MTMGKLKQLVVDEANDFYFSHKNVRAGIENTITNGRIIYDVWWGNKEKQYLSFDDVVNDKFYDGKSIMELLMNRAIVIDFV